MRTILIVEDDESFRQLLRTVLETRGFNVLLAESAEEGLGLEACHSLDAIVTDYRMPKENGLNLCRELNRVSAAQSRQVPVWLMTGCPWLSEKEVAAAGAEGIFRKPFRVAEISRTIERRLDALCERGESCVTETSAT